jgi:hypothetical protein
MCRGLVFSVLIASLLGPVSGANGGVDEVLYLAYDGDAYIPPDSPANLYEDDVIDFKDYSILASEWLESLVE